MGEVEGVAGVLEGLPAVGRLLHALLGEVGVEPGKGFQLSFRCIFTFKQEDARFLPPAEFVELVPLGLAVADHDDLVGGRHPAQVGHEILQLMN